jgi:hypothetical protein
MGKVRSEEHPNELLPSFPVAEPMARNAVVVPTNRKALGWRAKPTAENLIEGVKVVPPSHPGNELQADLDKKALKVFEAITIDLELHLWSVSGLTPGFSRGGTRGLHAPPSAASRVSQPSTWQ